MSVIINGGLIRPPTTEEVYKKLGAKLGRRISGYQLVQVNGQRKLFNPTLMKIVTPPEGCELFIGKLPRDLYEDELVPPLMSIGPIFELRTMMNFSGTTRGYAFVCYCDQETARRAKDMLDNFEIRRGQFIGVVPSINNRKLEIKGLPNLPQLKTILHNWLSARTEGVEELFLYPFRKNTLRIAVLYNSHRAAAMARRLLIPLKNEYFGFHVEIDWWNPKLEAKMRCGV